MDNGVLDSIGALKLCTDAFTLKEVQFLCDMLYSKYNINCHPQFRSEEKWRLYIASSELHKVRTLVMPYLIPSMVYKVGEQS
jgi:hypothetical protein